MHFSRLLPYFSLPVKIRRHVTQYDILDARSCTEKKVKKTLESQQEYGLCTQPENCVKEKPPRVYLSHPCLI
jgi:hypothetical protein